MPRYLVVDDSPTIRLMMVNAVKRASPGLAEVEQASDEASALEAFRKHDPDVVFLDMMIPTEPVGLKLLGAFLAEKPSARVVMVTGHPKDHPAVIEAVSTGAFDYIQKPVRVESIQRVIEQIDVEEGRSGRIS